MRNSVVRQRVRSNGKRLVLLFLVPTFLLAWLLALHQRRIEAGEIPVAVHDTNHELVNEISESDFKRLALDSSKPVLIDFYASWCYPCKMLGPVVSDLSRDYVGKASFYRIDIDKNPQLANKYRIDGIPALKVFKDGKVVAESVGLRSKQEISAMLERVLLVH